MSNFSHTEFRKFRAARFFHAGSAAQRTAVAVSACLGGEKVRYDGADKFLPMYPLLSRELNLIPICPEVGAGLGVPRPPVQLIAVDGEIRARGRDDRHLDVTTALRDFAEESLRRVSHDYSLCGYLWKSRSPSCGFGSTPLFDAHGNEIARTHGIQADRFRLELPHLNHGEETALTTESAAMAFVLRCRLVFDVLHASIAPLRALHEHYGFLHRLFEGDIETKLQTLSGTDDKRSYLVAFLMGCNQISEERLMNLFSETREKS